MGHASDGTQELLLATEPPAEFSKAVEVMKQMAQGAIAASQAKQMDQESLAASQLPKQPVDVKSELSTDMKPVDVKSEPSTGEPSLESTSIFVGSIPRDWTDEYIHAYLALRILTLILEKKNLKKKRFPTFSSTYVVVVLQCCRGLHCQSS